MSRSCRASGEAPFGRRMCVSNTIEDGIFGHSSGRGGDGGPLLTVRTPSGGCERFVWSFSSGRACRRGLSRSWRALGGTHSGRRCSKPHARCGQVPSVMGMRRRRRLAVHRASTSWRMCMEHFERSGMSPRSLRTARRTGRGAGWGGNAWCSALGMGPSSCAHHEERGSGVGSAKGCFVRPCGV